MKKYLIIALLMVIGLGLTVVFSQDDTLEAELEALINENLTATQAEDLDAMLQTIHSESPTYDQTANIAERLFLLYDLNYEKHIFRYIGMDGDYALARLYFCTTKITGPDFQNNCLDTIHVFKQENGIWKIWSMAHLEIENIE